MKKAFTVIVCVFILLSILPSCSKKISLSLTIGLEKDLLPYCYYNEKNEIDGVYVQALKKIAKKAGISNIRFSAYDKDELIEKLKSGDIDCIASKYNEVYDEFEKSGSFFFTGSAFLLMGENEFSQAKTLSDLSGAKACCLKGCIEEKNLKLENVGYSDSEEDAARALENGEYDVFFGDYFVARALRAKYNTSLALQAYPDAELEGDSNCHFLFFNNDDNGFMNDLNDGISKFTMGDAEKIAENQMKKIR